MIDGIPLGQGDSVDTSLNIPTPKAPEILNAAQLHALLDILTHFETYAEVEQFKDPSTISKYGYPFLLQAHESQTHRYNTDSSAPLLADLLNSIVLPVPGVRDLPPEFWHLRFQGILTSLTIAELSDSYDTGTLGTRKTLATAASAIHEVISRGILGGLPRQSARNLNGFYDKSQARDLVRAWDDAVNELVYGDLVNELFDCATSGKNLEEHSPAVRAAADYIIIHLATFLHHVFVLSPQGPYLLKLAENVHKLVPYSVIRQTLRIGNAATMIAGMMKLLLAKMSVGSISNWLGLTQNADDGMNLLQRIISLVLSYDCSEFRKTVEKIEKAKVGPSKAYLAAIKNFVEGDRSAHDLTRKISIQTPTSMVAAILEPSTPDLTKQLSADHHRQLLEYYYALLAIRDREEITKSLCRQNPDLFTQAIRDLAAAFDHMIRAIHENVDLREHVTAAENFITDFINTSRPKKRASSSIPGTTEASIETQAPSVEDYVGLLRRNRQSLYNWLHQIATQCPQVRDDFRAWCKDAVKVFRQNQRRASSLSVSMPNSEERPGSEVNARRRGAAGALSSNLQALFTSLPTATRGPVLAAIDVHATYLTSLETSSLERMQHILDDMPGGVLAKENSQSKRSICGPGMFLARWQQLMDDTIVAPAIPNGPLRCGKDVKGLLTKGKTVSPAARDGWNPAELARLAERDVPRPPDTGVVAEALGERFRKLVVDLWKHKQVGR